MNRRQFIGATIAGAATLSPRAWAANGPGPRIAELEILTVKVNTRPWTTFRVKTDSGLTGIGDASHGSEMPTLAASVARQMFKTIKGRTPFEIERLRQVAAPMVLNASEEDKRPHAVAHSGLEQCMWDLQGKIMGVPCYQLFGGKLRDEVRNYANINRATRGADRTPEGFSANAQRAIEAGFDAFKLAAFDHLERNAPDSPEREKEIQYGIRCLDAVRETIGPNRDILVDGHSRFSRQQALDLLPRLEHLNLFWLEEFCHATDDLAAVTRAATMPTAGGEALYGMDEFYPYIQAGAADILMPDMKFCGGMAELKKISVIAQGAGALTSPHGPSSPVGNMAAAHVCVTMPNFQILELAHGEVPWRADTVKPAEEVQNGRLSVPDRPGIGYELNDERWQTFDG